jgi:hypothetical protein
MTFRRGYAIAALVVLFLLAVGCSGGEGDSADDARKGSSTQGPDSTSGGDKHESYADAFTEFIDNPRVAAADARCMGKAYVDAIGLETLEAAGTPDELRAAGGQLPSFGVHLDEATAGTLFDALNACADMRTLVFGGQRDLSPDAWTCLKSRVPDEVFRAFMISTYTSDNGLSDDPKLQAQVSTALDECSAR